eukprot:TRINITY_DN2475_c0_g5_i1.p1 TRINITY_DN2475_c0_g5~~TRINITY_DN2475_c0_g5_i1.p1  ORF type:complete len:976 (+),score=283.61 TRINITY_DN2475_c0_g5_i1:60-2930(+)
MSSVESDSSNTFFIGQQLEHSFKGKKSNVMSNMIDHSIPIPSHTQEESTTNEGAPRILGTFAGVFTPVVLNIFGVILFLRLGKVVGVAGVWQALLIVMLSVSATLITSLSMSALATNGTVKGGGCYYLIARSVGPEFGGAIGLVFFLASAIGVTIYVIGFCEVLVDLIPSLTGKTTTDMQVYGAITVVVIFLMVVIGVGWIVKVQYFLLILVIAAILMFIIGVFVKPPITGSFEGFSFSLLVNNLGPNYAKANSSFFAMLGVFFPAVTGIMAGANMSGDLKDASTSIPKGTLLAKLATTLVYFGLVFLFAGSITNKSLIEDMLIMIRSSLVSEIVYAGVIAATISSAIAAFMGAPRVLQALARDKIFPFVNPFAKGRESDDNPIRATVLTFVIAFGFVLIGNLDAIAPLISNFYLTSYALINYSTFAAESANMPSFRPTFKYFSKWVSLFGALECVAFMLLIDPITAIISILTIVILYLYISSIVKDIDWGDATRANVISGAVKNIRKLAAYRNFHHVKLYRPHILVIGDLNNKTMINFASDMVQEGGGLCVVGNVIPLRENEEFGNKALIRQKRVSDLQTYIADNKLKAVVDVVVSPSLTDGIRSLLNISGLSIIRPNILMMPFPEHYNTIHEVPEVTQRLCDDFVNSLRDAARYGYSLMISRRTDFLYNSVVAQSGAKGSIDVYWMINDGGLTMLLPYLIQKHQNYENCVLRLFVVGSNDSTAQQITELVSKLRFEVKIIVVPTERVSFAMNDTELCHMFTIGHTVMPSVMNKTSKQANVFDMFKDEEEDDDDENEEEIDTANSAELPNNLLDSQQIGPDSIELDIPDIVDSTQINKYSVDRIVADLNNFDLTFSDLQDVARQADIHIVEAVKKWRNVDIPQEHYQRTAHIFRLCTVMREYSANAKIVYMNMPIPRSNVPNKLFLVWNDLLSSVVRTPVCLIRGSGESVLTFEA